MSREAKTAAGIALGFLAVFGLFTLLMSLPSSFPILGASQMLGCFGCVGWAYLVGRRVLSLRMRRLLQASALLLALLSVLQLLKYDFTAETSLANRLLWYAIYIPLTFTPLLTFYAALLVGTPKARDTLRPWLWLGVPALLLAGTILTNDLHQLAFGFDGPPSTWTSDADRYGLIYFAEVIWIAVLLLTAVVVATVRCGRKTALKSVPVVLVPLVFGGIYLVLYALKGPHLTMLGKWRGPYFQSVIILMFLFFWEALIRVGAIPSNSGYAQLFEAATFPAYIADAQGKVRFRTGAPMQANAQQRAAAAGGPVATGSHTLLHAMTIPGGSVSWTSDLSQVHAARNRLGEVRAQLTENNERLAEQNSLVEERSRNEAKTRLFERAYAQVEPELAKLEASIAQARSAGSDGAENRADIERVLLWGSFVKRRANLGIVAEQQGFIPTDELALAVHETLAALELCGSGGAVVAESAAQLVPEQVYAAYAAFHMLALALWEAHMPCSVHIESRLGLALRITTQTAFPEETLSQAAAAIAAAGGKLSSSREGDTSFVDVRWEVLR